MPVRIAESFDGFLITRAAIADALSQARTAALFGDKHGGVHRSYQAVKLSDLLK